MKMKKVERDLENLGKVALIPALGGGIESVHRYKKCEFDTVIFLDVRYGNMQESSVAWTTAPHLEKPFTPKLITDQELLENFFDENRERVLEEEKWRKLGLTYVKKDNGFFEAKSISGEHCFDFCFICGDARTTDISSVIPGFVGADTTIDNCPGYAGELIFDTHFRANTIVNTKIGRTVSISISELKNKKLRQFNESLIGLATSPSEKARKIAHIPRKVIETIFRLDIALHNNTPLSAELLAVKENVEKIINI